MANQIHVTPHNDGWDVQRDNALKPTNHFGTKAEAVTRARELAIKDGLELVIHNKDGTISEKDSHGPDKSPPKG